MKISKVFFLGQFLLCSMISISASGANITISGPNLICPLQPATYTASATWIGSQKGCFEFQFYENGQWNFPESISCPCYGQSSSRSYTYTWQYTGNNKVRVRFFANPDPLCVMDIKDYNVEVRVFEPGVPTDASGGLTFCSSSQTKTVTIPGILYDTEHCDYHYKYDWIIPTGWSAAPSDILIPYTSITGGIRTFATSVNITTQSTALSQGYSGNYSITVKTEDVWPYPRQNSKQVWIGIPQNPGGISGPTVVNEGSVYTFSLSACQGTQTYNWTWPSGWAAPATTTKAQAVVTPYTNSGDVTVTPSNSCSTSSTSSSYVTINTCSNCRMYVSPNPVQSSMSIGYVDASSKSEQGVEYSIQDLSGTSILKDRLYDSEKQIDLSQLKNGIYIVVMKLKNGETEKHRIIKQ
jgi:hypothetical protein